MPAAFVEVVERALAPAPGARFASAGEFERALAAVAVSVPAAANAAARHAVEKATARRRAPWVLTGVGGLLVAFVGGALLLRGGSAPPGRGGASSTGPAPAATAPTAAAPAGAAASAMPVATPAAPAPLEVQATLLRVEGTLTEPLSDGAAIGPGDHLALEIACAEPVYAYVLDEDEHGEVHALFPLRGQGATNPLPGGRTHRLPGHAAGKPLDWVVTSAGGRETFLLAASREPLEALEEAVRSMPAAARDSVSYARVSEAALRRVRGVGGLAEGTAPTQGGVGSGKLVRLAQALASSKHSPGLWTRVVVLWNPGP
jgi:hypothetical protein